MRCINCLKTRVGIKLSVMKKWLIFIFLVSVYSVFPQAVVLEMDIMYKVDGWGEPYDQTVYDIDRTFVFSVEHGKVLYINNDTGYEECMLYIRRGKEDLYNHKVAVLSDGYWVNVWYAYEKEEDNYLWWNEWWNGLIYLIKSSKTYSKEQFRRTKYYDKFY